MHPPRNRKGESGNPLPKAGASELYPNNHAVYSKNREHVLNEEIAEGFFQRVLAPAKPYMSDEHFTVDGTLIEAWASHKSFRPNDGTGKSAGPGGDVDLRGEKRKNQPMNRPPTRKPDYLPSPAEARRN